MNDAPHADATKRRRCAAGGDAVARVTAATGLDAAIFADPDDTDLDYTAEMKGGGELPSWLDFDAEALRFDAAPGANAGGVHEVVLSASDGAKSTEATITFDVEVVNQPPKLRVDQVPYEDGATLVEGEAFDLAPDTFPRPRRQRRRSTWRSHARTARRCRPGSSSTPPPTSCA